MIIIRPIRSQDLPIFAEFSFESLLGITSLPRDRDKLLEKIVHSENCFRNQIKEPQNEEYYFVLEDLTTNRIGGICGISVQSSQNRNLFYEICEKETKAKHLSAPKSLKILKTTEGPGNCSEICSLYLQPSFRHSGLGRLLSLSRFLFIAAHHHRFHKKIVAEMRGFIDDRQISPFWEAIGRHFCNLSFVELMTQLDQDRTFISEIIPEFPIYIDLLPPEAQEVIGKTHQNTLPALNMLLQENFILNQLIDVFDAGPLMIVDTQAIRTIKNSTVCTVSIAKTLLPDETEFLISNEQIDFRCCFGRIQFESPDLAVINQETADALGITEGSQIRYVTIHQG